MREEWLKERSRGLGGSDAAAACGVSPWKTPYQLWLEKRGAGQPQEDNEPMFWGRILEPVIRQRYADVTGRTVTIPKEILIHPKHSFMLASLDGIAGDRVLEIKTARSQQGWGEPSTDEIPDYYMMQISHYMIVTGLTLADVAVLIGGSDFRIYTIEADPVLSDLIINRESDFWQMVVDGTPPEATTFADIRRKWGGSSQARRVQANLEVLEAIRRLKELKDLVAEEEALKALIMAHMKEADTLVNQDQIIATWKLAKPTKRLDAKALQEARPEVYQEFLKEGEASRRLLIK